MATKKKLPKGMTRLEIDLPTVMVDRANTILAKRGTNIQTLMTLQLRVIAKSKKPLSLSDRMNFGKYEGALVEDIVRGDPGYITFLVQAGSGAKFANDTIELYQKLTSPNVDLDGEIPF